MTHHHESKPTRYHESKHRSRQFICRGAVMAIIAWAIPAIDHTDDATRAMYMFIGFGGCAWCLVAAAGEYLLKKMSLSLDVNRMCVHAVHVLMLAGATRYLLMNEVLQQASTETLASIAMHFVYVAAAIPLVAIADHLLSLHQDRVKARARESKPVQRLPAAEIDYGAEFETVR
ncbi:MAG: hypothetical protein JWL75_203 [Parcubacteria group bacterium]|nr:hypothetical protein [Parcubacteria group bacterium]